MEIYTIDLFNYQGLFNIVDDAAIFPVGSGWTFALMNMSNYPFGTIFYEIATEGVICSFASITSSDERLNSNENRYYDIAFFPKDLIELHKRGFISGLIPMTEYDREINTYQRLLFLGCPSDDNGTLNLYTGDNRLENKTLKIPKPNLREWLNENFWLEDFDEINDVDLEKYYESAIQNITDSEFEFYFKFIKYPEGVKLTLEGIEEIIKISVEIEVPERIEVLVRPLINIGYFESAVREVAIMFEDMIKKFHQSDKYGQRLIEYHIQHCIKVNKENYNAGIKVYRNELITLNKYIRNPHMHSSTGLKKDTYQVILYRQCYVFSLMSQAFEKLLEN